MNDNILGLVDLRRQLGEEPLTVEGALFAGLPPLRDLPPDAQEHHRMLRLAREYLVDFDLAHACARAALDWNLVKGAERDAKFITLCRMLLEEMKPDEVVTRAEVLMMLKREATTASKASDRITAINHLARLAGMELQEDKKGGGAPVINIILNNGPAEAKPMINVTHSADAPERLL